MPQRNVSQLVLRPRWAVSPHEPANTRALTVASSLTVLAGGLVAFAAIDLRPDLRVEDSGWRALFIGFLLIALHIQPRRSVAARGNMETINLDELLFVPTMCVLQPWHSIAAVAVASLAGSVAVRRSPMKSAFNIGQMTIATAAGIFVVAWLGASPAAHPSGAAVLAAMAAALAMTSVTAVVVRAMVAFATGMPVAPLLADIGHSVVPWIGAILLGAVGVIAVVAEPVSVVLMAGVVFFVQRAYAATFRELAARRLAERLQQGVGSLRSHTNPGRVRDQLVGAACDLLGAGAAQIIEGDAPLAADSLSAPLGAGRRLTVGHRQGPGTWTPQDLATLTTLAGVAGDVLRSAEAISRLRTITDSQSEGVIALDVGCRITFANPAARKMMGVPDGGDVEVPVDTVLTLRDVRRPVDLVAMVARQQITNDDDATLVSNDGAALEVAYSLTPLHVDGAHVGAVLVLRDVTERRAFDRVLEHRALHDDLTGLPNRRLLQERLELALSRSKSTGSKHGLLFLDLDRFKLVNDSYGHLAGDKLLIQIAQRLRTNLSESDSLARLSGDEFIVLLEDVPGIERVREVADSLLEVVRQPLDLNGQTIFMSASIGVVLTHSAQGREEALALADAATYAAKAAGGDCHRVSTRSSVEAARTRLDMEARLRRGLENDELLMLYQPIVATTTLQVEGAEGLVRWDAAGRGIIEPAHFIPLAEETGLIVPLGRWVLLESCRTAQAWTVAHPDLAPLRISVNLSALQFGQHRLADEVASTLETTGLAPSQLCLEITESVLMGDTVSTLVTLQTLRELGVSVAIDDFGTGYSALSYLKHFPIDVVKLDRSFIIGLEIDQVDTEIVKAVIALSEALGIRTVAEGVEEVRQMRVLARMGCSSLQGYLIARPLAPDAFIEFWLQHPTKAPPPPLVGLVTRRQDFTGSSTRSENLLAMECLGPRPVGR